MRRGGVPSIRNHVQVAVDLRPETLKVETLGLVAVRRAVDEERAMVGHHQGETAQKTPRLCYIPARAAEHAIIADEGGVLLLVGPSISAAVEVDVTKLKVGDEVEIIGLTEERAKTVVTGIEMFRKTLDYAEAGDNIGALLRGVQRKDIERGQVLCKPGSIHPLTKFEGQVYVLKKEEGGRHTPFFTNYRPQFYFRTTDVTGVITLPEGKEMCMPGDNVTISVELITPIAIEEGLRFAIREGGRTVGSGVVTKVIG